MTIPTSYAWSRNFTNLFWNGSFTGKPCVNGHLALRTVTTTQCLTCRYEYTKAYHAAHPEMKRASDKKWAAKNRERVRGKGQVWRENNRDRRNKREREWGAKNPEKAKARRQKWSKKNPHRILAYANERRLLVKQQTPAWANMEAILAVYAEAHRRNRLAATKYTVDHVVPLKGRNVCGLHVESNLQIIPQSENSRKHNKFDESLL